MSPEVLHEHEEDTEEQIEETAPAKKELPPLSNDDFDVDLQGFFREMGQDTFELNKIERVDTIPDEGIKVAEGELESKGGFGAVRRQILEIGRPYMPPDDLEDFILAVGEAAANGIKHGQGYAAYEVYLSPGQENPDKLLVRIVDHGTGIAQEVFAAKEEHASHSTINSAGQGFKIMSGMSDGVKIATNDNGTVVQLVKNISPQHAEPQIQKAA